MDKSRTIDRLMKDIQTIKSAIRKNTGVFQKIYLPVQIRWVAIIGGLLVIVFCMALYILIHRFGSYSGIPLKIKLIWYSGILLSAVLVGLFKAAKLVKPFKKIDPNYNYSSLLKEIFSTPFLMSFGLEALVLIVVFSVYAVLKGNPWLISPILAIGLGFYCKIIGSMLYLKEYIALSYWLLLAGLLTFFLPQIHPLFALSVTFGLGMVFLGLLTFVHVKDKGVGRL